MDFGSGFTSSRAAIASRFFGSTCVTDCSAEAGPTAATTVAAVSLAWLLSRPAVVAPIASARTPEQLAELLPVANLRLTVEEQNRLSGAA